MNRNEHVDGDLVTTSAQTQVTEARLRQVVSLCDQILTTALTKRGKVTKRQVYAWDRQLCTIMGRSVTSRREPWLKEILAEARKAHEQRPAWAKGSRE